MVATIDFSEWPPRLSNGQLEELALLATTYALSHGLLYLPLSKSQPCIPSTAIHAPLSLFPSPFPRRLFEHSQRLQRVYNILYARIAMDHEFLDEVMGAFQGVGQVDEFTGNLWTGWKQIRDAGVKQSFHLGLFRSDYLLHCPADSESQAVSLKQVEFNTISSSFGPLSERVTSMHKYLQSATQYFNASPHLKTESIPPNDTTAGLATGLAAAHRAYGINGSQILFVVQAGERNVFDQRWLEYELLEKHSIHVLRQTFDELTRSANLDPETNALLITLPDESPVEISTVYFRAGYTPNDYPTPEHYDLRFLLERSSAINCPSIPLQLAGGKKVQEELTHRDVLERFLSDHFSPKIIDEVRTSWMGMWSLDYSEDQLGQDQIPPHHDSERQEPLGIRKAREQALSLVLKPQREGGGNNIYKDAIPSFLDSLPVKERRAWIAMELIIPPKGTSNYLLRAAAGTDEERHNVVRTEVVSELGIFGWALFGGPNKEIEEKEVGWLVRTKGQESNEGGVATGFSVLDSIFLVDD